MAASCIVGAINFKISRLNYGTRRETTISAMKNLRPLTEKKAIEHPGLRTAQRNPWKVLSTSATTSLEALELDSEVLKDSGSTSELIPNFNEVESLLATMCDTTTIVEVDLKVSGFELRVTRSSEAKLSKPPQPIVVPVSLQSQTVSESPASNGSVSSPTMALEISSRSVRSLMDSAADEGLIIIRSPKVGFFRRSRTIKGKRAPPPCKEKQTVKEGQVVCYIEQLGGELPIESDVSGEVIKIMREDGEPIGYNDHLIAILPSFPGIKKLQ